MVKLLLCLLLFGSDTDLLITSPNCIYCKKAEAIVVKLQGEGYDVKIVDSKEYKVRAVPTLIVRTGNKTLSQITGLLSEQKYRSLISKNLCFARGSINDFTGSVNFVIGTEPKTLLYRRIISRAKKSHCGYLEYNPDNQPELVKQFQINRLPTLLILKNGKELGRYIGVIPYRKIVLDITVEIK